MAALLLQIAWEGQDWHGCAVLALRVLQQDPQHPLALRVLQCLRAAPTPHMAPQCGPHGWAGFGEERGMQRWPCAARGGGTGRQVPWPNWQWSSGAQGLLGVAAWDAGARFPGTPCGHALCPQNLPPMQPPRQRPAQAGDGVERGGMSSCQLPLVLEGGPDLASVLARLHALLVGHMGNFKAQLGGGCVMPWDQATAHWQPPLHSQLAEAAGHAGWADGSPSRAPLPPLHVLLTLPIVVHMELAPGQPPAPVPPPGLPSQSGRGAGGGPSQGPPVPSSMRKRRRYGTKLRCSSAITFNSVEVGKHSTLTTAHANCRSRTSISTRHCKAFSLGSGVELLDAHTALILVDLPHTYQLSTCRIHSNSNIYSVSCVHVGTAHLWTPSSSRPPSSPAPAPCPPKHPPTPLGIRQPLLLRKDLSLSVQ